MAEHERNDTKNSPDTTSGTTNEEDFGRTDRYANKDGGKNANVTMTGDGTSWDTGRTSSITEGTRVENDLRDADAESPGVPGPKPGRE